MQYLDEISCVMIGLASADTRHLQQSLHRIWPLLGHAEQSGIGENDEGGHTIRLRSFAAPFAQPLDQCRVNPDLASNVVAKFAIPGSRQRLSTDRAHCNGGATFAVAWGFGRRISGPWQSPQEARDTLTVSVRTRPGIRNPQVSTSPRDSDMEQTSFRGNLDGSFSHNERHHGVAHPVQGNNIPFKTLRRVQCRKGDAVSNRGLLGGSSPGEHSGQIRQSCRPLLDSRGRQVTECLQPPPLPEEQRSSTLAKQEGDRKRAGRRPRVHRRRSEREHRECDAPPASRRTARIP